MACEDIQAKLNALVEQKNALNEQIKDLQAEHLKGQLATALKQLQTLNNQIAATQHSLNDCLGIHPPPSGAAPQSILAIDYANPSFDPAAINPDNPDDWARIFVPEGTFPPRFVPEKLAFRGATREWRQVLAPDDEYDQFTLVGATGWVIEPELSGADVPFSHPFGTDWEFMLAMDPDPQHDYNRLLALGNTKNRSSADLIGAVNDYISKTNKNVIDQNRVPGLLGVEWDQNLVPKSFQNEVHEGDRAAVFGRWIVHCGHDSDDHPLCTEIHPPLLMACAHLITESDGSEATRVVFTSRPYLVGQTFVLDTDHIYDDAAEDDGDLMAHMIKEIRKVDSQTSLAVEAHPKIKSYPFKGAHLLHLIIKPPPLPDTSVTHSVKNLSISFHFTVRSGCAVQVISTAPGTVDVFIAMSHGGYTPPHLPERHTHRYDKDELGSLSKDVKTPYTYAEVVSGIVELIKGGSILGPALLLEVEAILVLGVKTDEYAPLPVVDVFDKANGVTVNPGNIPAGVGSTQDDIQPFPVFGWLEARWVDPGVLEQ